MSNDCSDRDAKIKGWYILRKINLLEQFGVCVNDSVRGRLNSLYPNKIAIENYTKMLISKRLAD